MGTGYNDFNVYCRELAPGTVSLTGDMAHTRATTVNNALIVTENNIRTSIHGQSQDILVLIAYAQNPPLNAFADISSVGPAGIEV